MPVYTIFLWAIIGAIVGWQAKRIFGKIGRFGLIGDIIIGIVGAIIGGYLIGLLGATGTGGILVSLLTALVFSVLLIWLYGKVLKK